MHYARQAKGEGRRRLRAFPLRGLAGLVGQDDRAALGDRRKLQVHAVALAALGRPQRPDAGPGRAFALRHKPDNEGGAVVGRGWGLGFLGHGTSPFPMLQAASIAAFLAAPRRPPSGGGSTRKG